MRILEVTSSSSWRFCRSGKEDFSDKFQLVPDIDLKPEKSNFSTNKVCIRMNSRRSLLDSEVIKRGFLGHGKKNWRWKHWKAHWNHGLPEGLRRRIQEKMRILTMPLLTSWSHRIVLSTNGSKNEDFSEKFQLIPDVTSGFWSDKSRISGTWREKE